MDFYQRLLSYKAVNKMSWGQIGSHINKEQATIRIAVNRKSLSELEKKELEKLFDSKSTGIEKGSLLDEKEINKELFLIKDGVKIDTRDVSLFVVKNHNEMINSEPLFNEWVKNLKKDAIIEFLESKQKR